MITGGHQTSSHTMTPKLFKPYFKDTRYGVLPGGIIWSRQAHRQLMTKIRPDGYVRIAFPWGAKYAHVFIWETLNECNVPKGHQIDHIDGNRSNNRPSNLQLLSNRAHYEKTKRPRKPRPASIFIEPAQRVTLWKYPLRGIGAMRNGQIVNAKGCLKTTHESGGYLRAPCNDNKYIGVHTIICTAFHGPQPPDHTADHIDRNTRNNAADNLRWASRHAQARNKSNNVAIRAFQNTEERALVGEWTTLTDAVADINIDLSDLSKAVRKGWVRKGMVFERVG